MTKKLFKIIVLGTILLFGGVAHADLRYPRDCKASKIIKGAKHHKIKGGSVVTLLPNTVKPNGTCRGIINAINSQCK